MTNIRCDRIPAERGDSEDFRAEKAGNGGGRGRTVQGGRFGPGCLARIRASLRGNCLAWSPRLRVLPEPVRIRGEGRAGGEGTAAQGNGVDVASPASFPLSSFRRLRGLVP